MCAGACARVSSLREGGARVYPGWQSCMGMGQQIQGHARHLMHAHASWLAAHARLFMTSRFALCEARGLPCSRCVLI